MSFLYNVCKAYARTHQRVIQQQPHSTTTTADIRRMAPGDVILHHERYASQVTPRGKGKGGKELPKYKSVNES